MNDKKTTLRDKVLDAIHSGRVKMRPRWHFVLKTILAISGTAIVLLALLYLASFILFILRQTGVWFVPAFGFRGVVTFLFSLPWLLILISVIFVVILEILVRRYAFAFRRPLLYSVLGIVLFVILGSFVVARTSFHRGVFRYAQSHQLPVAGPLYREFGMHRMRQVHPGTIRELTDQGFILENPSGETLVIVISPQTRLPFGFDFGEGDAVVVFGERDNDTVRAAGIRKIDEHVMDRVPRKPGMYRQFRPPMYR